MLNRRAAFVAFVHVLFGSSRGLDISCDAGWQGFSQSPSCYTTVVRQKENFADAREICKRFGGDLAVIDLEPERNFLAKAIGSVDSTLSTWRVGLVFNETENKFKWINGADLEVEKIPWETGYPKTLATSSCGVLSHYGKLEDAPCSEAKHFVCEKNLGALRKCPAEWEQFHDSCYRRYHLDLVSWDEARTQCVNHASDLVVVNDLLENSYVYGFASEQLQDVWIGIRENITSDGTFYWVDGRVDSSEGVHAQWEDGQPASNAGKNAGFVAMASGGNWSTQDAYNKLGFICEKLQSDVCQFDMVGHGDSCYDFYLLIDQHHNWDASRQYCNELGMEITSVESGDEDEWLNSYLYDTEAFSSGVNTVDGMWIGYREESANSQRFLRSSDNAVLGDEGVFDSRKAGLTYDPEKEDCLYMSVCNGDDCDFFSEPGRRWNNSNCDETGNSVAGHMHSCELRKGLEVNISGIMQPADICPPGWGEAVVGFCYLAVQREEDWGAARAFCKANNSFSDLVSIHSVFENDLVLNMAKGKDFWIGFNDRLTQGTWQWSDNSPVSFTDWNPNEPNDVAGENCGEIDVVLGGWNDDDCSEKQSFICMAKAGKDPSGYPELPEHSTPPPSENCGFGGDGWVEDVNTGMCYHVVEDYMSWSDARTECRFRAGFDEMGDLASIANSNEQTFLNTYLLALGHNAAFWIGLNDKTAEGGFAWTDGVPLSYINWNDGQPDNWYEAEHCIELTMWQRGSWNDGYCNASRPALCEKRGRNYIAPPTPVPPVPKCPAGWEDSFERCYFFSNTQGMTAQNYSEASTYCQSFGATLTPIRSQAEHDYVRARVSENTFIGATDLDEEGVWRWDEDGANIVETFVNWGPGEPNGGDADNCLEVMMEHDGKWNDVYCNAARSFVCSRSNVICPHDWEYYNGYCYHSSSMTAFWPSARDKCKEASNRADLVSVHSDSENRHLTFHLNGSAESWIGYEFKEGAWVWSDGSPSDYEEPWAANEPGDNPSEKPCVAVTEDGTWKSVHCESSHTYQCKLKPDHYLGCEPGWSLYDGYCYLVQTEVATWDEAEQLCGRRGGDLVSILSSGENAYVDTLIYDSLGCPESWVTDAERGKCYLFRSAQVPWETARQTCVDADAQLVIIDSEDKNKYILDLVKTQVFWGMWIGGSDLETENTWKWLNGNNVNDGYKNWLENNPDGGTNENCLDFLVTTNLDPGKWNDNNCTILQPFLCEKDSQPKVKAAKWIGLNDLTQPQTFTWTDRSAVTFTYWGVNEPVKHLGDAKNCVFMDAETSTWKLSECDSTFSSVCKRPSEIVAAPEVPDGCEQGQIAYADSCYEIHTERVSFIEAQSVCQQKFGHLVTITSDLEQNKITSIVAQYKHHYYVGLQYNPTYSMFEWVTDEWVSKTYWGPNEPNTGFDDGGAGKCVHLIDTDPMGLWQVSACSEMHPYLCEYPRSGYTAVPTTPTTTWSTHSCLDPYWSSRDGHCYKVETSVKSFESARAACAKYGGDLVSFSSKEEEDFVKTLNVFSVEHWIGLREPETGGGYEWSDGSGFDYNNWQADYPNSNGGQELCVMALDQWRNYACEQKLAFVCEALEGAPTPPTETPPTPPTDVACQGQDVEAGWIQLPFNDTYCYKFETMNPLSFHDAEASCMAQGGHLASIHSEEENTDIYAKLFSLIYSSSAWIGMWSKTVDGNYHWIDGTPDNYWRWFEDEPNNHFDMESCVAMYSNSIWPDYGSRWNDDHCGERHGFVCKKPRSGDVPTPEPTQMPPGHCPQDAYEFNGHCYYAFGLTEETQDAKTNQTEARARCKDIDAGYDLVSIHSEREMAFVTTILGDPSFGGQNVWIGLNDYWNEGNFVWFDESNSNYFNWNIGEPNDSQFNEDCVEMMGKADGGIQYTGRWNDKYCDTISPYVCKSKASTSNAEPPPQKKCEIAPYEAFDAFYGNCFLRVDQNIRYSEAEQYCRDRSSYLVTVTDAMEQAFMFNYVDTESMWMGLNNRGHHNEYVWLDGWPVQFSNFASDPPLDQEACVSFNQTDGKWYGKSCETTHHFVCKHTTKTIPTSSPSARCKDDTWMDLDGDFCYKFVDGEVGQYEANNECLTHGGPLASIHSVEELNMLHPHFQHFVHDVWIGLYYEEAEGVHKWEDGTAFVYDNWAEGEPNGMGNGEDCTVIYKSDARWNDHFCNAFNGYICKSAKVTDTTTQAPPTPPTTDAPATTATGSTSSSAATTTTTQGDNSLPSGGLGAGPIVAIVIVTLLVVFGAAASVGVWKQKELLAKLQFGYSRQGEKLEEGVQNEAYDQPPTAPQQTQPAE